MRLAARGPVISTALRVESKPMNWHQSSPLQKFSLAGGRFPEGVTAFRPEMAAHGKHNQPCPRCGSPMAYTADRYPGEVHLHIGTLADPNQFKPRGHVFAAEQLSWFEIADNLPRYAALGGKGVTPLRRGPRPAPGPEERR